MSEHATHHDTFVIERTYKASPERVYNAWADPVAKARWFGGPDEWGPGLREMDFTVGGRERLSAGPPGGPEHHFDSVYQDLVPNRRIIYTYTMHIDDKLFSISLATVAFEPKGSGTMMTFTEQAVYMIGGASSALGRKEGTQGLLDSLGAEVESGSAVAAT